MTFHFKYGKKLPLNLNFKAKLIEDMSYFSEELPTTVRIMWDTQIENNMLNKLLPESMKREFSVMLKSGEKKCLYWQISYVCVKIMM